MSSRQRIKGFVQCQRCGTSLRRDQRLFCSRICYEAFRHKERQCQQCGVVLVGRAGRKPRQRFCSFKCMGIPRRGRPPASLTVLQAMWAKNRSPEGSPLCTQCRVVLRLGENTTRTRFRNHDYLCGECFSKREGNRRAALRADVFLAYGGRCVCCEEYRQEFLTIDHIEGYEFRLGEPRGGYQLYAWLRRHEYPKEKFRLLCFNCNFSVAMFGYCPHGNISGPQLRSRGNRTEVLP